MIFLKPPWIRHEDNKPIFSVDIHPKGKRFVTGGQGGQGGRIVIWNMAPVVSDIDEADPKVPKMLCQMDNHLACVNVVRWSCQGHLLASGGDDKLVMIWKLTGEGSSTIFGGGGKVNVETWKCIHTLNAHNGDVLDVAWAPHDGWLASGSVDNTVIIWNTHKFPEKVMVLKGHTGMVKGVTWDPVGKYLASQSDDKSLRVWRTADWAQQEVVTDPFTDCSATTHVLRLSWSPDGQYLVSAHAMNGGGPTAQIIERDGWKQIMDFVGHRKAVTCVRFNSNILKKFNPDSPKTQQYCCCAIGSRDRSISVWLTSLKRPLVVIKELFEDSVLDISWSANGLHLLACSWDGTVACVFFDQKEIGTPLSTSEKNSLYERMYGKSLQKNLNQSYTGSQIIENPELLHALEEIDQADEMMADEVNALGGNSLGVNASGVNSTGLSSSGISASTANASGVNASGVNASGLNASGVNASGVNASGVNALGVNTSGINSLGVNVSGVDVMDVPVANINSNAGLQDSPKNILVPANKQIETRLPDGKRRIKPMFLKSVPSDPSNDTFELPTITEASAFSSCSPSKSKIVVVQQNDLGKIEVPGVAGSEVMGQGASGQGIPGQGIIGQGIAGQGIAGQGIAGQGMAGVGITGQGIQGQGIPGQLLQGNIALRTVPQTGLRQQAPGTKINQLMCVEVPGDEPIVQLINVLEPLKFGAGGMATKTDKVYKLQVTNNCYSTSRGSFARIEVFKDVLDKRCMWETYLGSPIKCLQNNRKYIVACCEDLSLNCYHIRSGARVLPPLLLEDTAAAICLTDSGGCLVLTKTGLIHMWNFETGTSIINRVSLRSLLSNGSTVSTCSLTESNLPIITLSDGRAYLYSLSLKTWTLLSNPLDPLSRAGGKMARSVSTNLPLASMQKSMPLHGSNDTLPSGVTLSFLESQITASSMLSSSTEFRHWTLTTVNHILDKGPECRLRSILDGLLGPTRSSAKKSKEDTIMGIPKKEMLKEILEIVKTKLPWQRLYNEYSEQITS